MRARAGLRRYIPRMRTQPAPNYLAKILALGETLPRRPGVHHVSVIHDDWCNLLSEKGPCNCDPEIGPMPGAS